MQAKRRGLDSVTLTPSLKRDPVTLVTVADIAAATRQTPAAVQAWLDVTGRGPVARLHGEPLYIPATTHALLEALAAVKPRPKKQPKKRARK
jgi:hypothetical protein